MSTDLRRQDVNEPQNQNLTRKEALERQLADLKARLPAHSIPPSMMMELDELEEQLAELRIVGNSREQTQ